MYDMSSACTNLTFFMPKDKKCKDGMSKFDSPAEGSEARAQGEWAPFHGMTMENRLVEKHENSLHTFSDVGTDSLVAGLFQTCCSLLCTSFPLSC